MLFSTTGRNSIELVVCPSLGRVESADGSSSSGMRVGRTVDERSRRTIEKVRPLTTRIRRIRRSDGRRGRSAGALVVVCVLLQLMASLQSESGLSLLAWLSHPHSHALLAVSDGSHIDLVYAHDRVDHADSEDDEASLHGDPSEDHVVHMTRDDAPVARRIATHDDGPATAATIPALPVLRLAASPPTPPLQRAVDSFSRRSVVLRI